MLLTIFLPPKIFLEGNMFLSDQQTEAFVFYLGCCFFASELVVILVLWFLHRELMLHVVAVITASVLGGRMASILAGQQLGLHPISITLILAAWNSTVLLVLFPLVISLSHNVIRVRFLRKMLESKRRAAEVQKCRVRRYGTWGLPIFIWLPFPWTGALVGAIIGFLLGVPLKRTLLIAIPSMVVGVASWVYGFQWFLLITGRTGKTISFAFLLAMLFFSVFRLFGVRRSH